MTWTICPQFQLRYFIWIKRENIWLVTWGHMSGAGPAWDQQQRLDHDTQSAPVHFILTFKNKYDWQRSNNWWYCENYLQRLCVLIWVARYRYTLLWERSSRHGGPGQCLVSHSDLVTGHCSTAQTLRQLQSCFSSPHQPSISFCTSLSSSVIIAVQAKQQTKKSFSSLVKYFSTFSTWKPPFLYYSFHAVEKIKVKILL